MHDFGYVALNMKYVNPEDSGTYTCRAVNDLGEAVTSATLFVQCMFYNPYSLFRFSLQLSLQPKLLYNLKVNMRMLCKNLDN